MNDDLFNDVKELCMCCAKGIVAISNKHKENPKLVSRLFIDVFTKIVEQLENV